MAALDRRVDVLIPMRATADHRKVRLVALVKPPCGSLTTASAWAQLRSGSFRLRPCRSSPYRMTGVAG
jgi:hypothetical protein